MPKDSVKMASSKYTAVLLIALLPVALGSADLIPKTLSDRIEALERRDTDQIARIALLEKHAMDSNEKLNILSASNVYFQKQLAYQAKKLQDKEGIIAELRKHVEHHKTVVGRNRRQGNILKSEMQLMCKMFADTREKHEKMPKKYKEMEIKTESCSDKIKTYNALTSKTARESEENDRSDLESDTRDLKKSTHVKDFDTARDTPNTIAEDKVHGTSKRKLNTRRNDIKQRTVRSIKEPVAFHAVHTQPTSLQPQIHDAVKFGDVLLNQGNDYHDRHRLFIAPQSGFYLFSTSKMGTTKPGHVEVQVSIMKNGARLARVFCHATDVEDQSSVTAVTRNITILN